MQRFISLLFPIVVLIAGTAAAQNRFIVRIASGHEAASGESAEQLLERLGFDLIRTVASRDGDLYVVSNPGQLSESVVEELLASEPRIQEVEAVQRLRLPVTTPTVEKDAVRDDLVTRARAFAHDQLESPSGSLESRYRHQALNRRLRLAGIHRYFRGAGVVAVIDTGVDPDHPALADSLVPGYDFVLDRPGLASEWSELDPELAAQLQQSTVAVLDQSTVAVLDQSTVAVLDQSTVAVLDQIAILNQSTVAVLDQELYERLASGHYRAFGHGTMVAGLVHLVAPKAKIMPLKAFRADGTSATDDIVDAIYHAVGNGADVINMSFSFQEFSPEVMRAVNYATRSGVICVSAAGNLGEDMLVYPASLANVAGVAATNVEGERSALSNYGEDLVTVGAVGEEVLSTYPGGRYASVFGTSFSTAIVAGSAALFLDIDADIDQYAAEAALAMGRERSGDLGHGELNLTGSMRWLQREWRRR